MNTYINADDHLTMITISFYRLRKLEEAAQKLDELRELATNVMQALDELPNDVDGKNEDGELTVSVDAASMNEAHKANSQLALFLKELI